MTCQISYGFISCIDEQIKLAERELKKKKYKKVVVHRKIGLAWKTEPILSNHILLIMLFKESNILLSILYVLVGIANNVILSTD